MRYHHEKPDLYFPIYGKTFCCDHPVFSAGTLYMVGNRGLVVIQQRYDSSTKHTWWGEIDPWLRNDIYLNKRFLKVFEERSDVEKEGYFPVITIRQLMWALKMKPIKREQWETVFDHKNI